MYKHSRAALLAALLLGSVSIIPSFASAAGLPDFKVLYMNGSSVIAGTQNTYAAMVTNTQSVDSLTPINLLLQRADSLDPTTGVAVNVQDVSNTLTSIDYFHPGVTFSAPVPGTFRYSHWYAQFDYTFPASEAGTVRYLRVCADKSSANDQGVVTELDETNNCSTWTPYSLITSTVANNPNVTASAPTYLPTGQVGKPNNIFQVVINAAPTWGTPNANLPVLLQTADTYNPATEIAGGIVDASTTIALSTGYVGWGNRVYFTNPFTPSDNGKTKYLRACADMSSNSDTGTFAENNETDNCSSWEMYSIAGNGTIAQVYPDITITNASVSILPPSVYAGYANFSSTVLLSYDVTNAGAAPWEGDMYNGYHENTIAGFGGSNYGDTNYFDDIHSLAAGASRHESVGLNFQNPGTYYLNPAAWAASSQSTQEAVSNWATPANWIPVTVSPDLTAGPTSISAGGSQATSTSAIVNIDLYFHSLIINQGTSGTGLSGVNYPHVLVQRADTYNFSTGVATNVQDIYSSSSLTSAPNIGAGYTQTLWFGSDATPLGYKFPIGDAGTTRYIRTCIDKSSAGDVGLVTESDETNNCGAWTPITVFETVPVVTTIGTANVTGTSAILMGTADMDGSLNDPNASGHEWFRYSTTNPGTCNDTFGTASIHTARSGTANYSVATVPATEVNTLTPGSTYYFCIIAVNDAMGNPSPTKVYGSVLSFTTPAPDLTFVAPGTISPTTAVGGSARTFSMNIKNVGGATTGAGTFVNVLQKATDASGTGMTRVAVASAGPLAAGASTAGFGIAYTFPVGDNGTTKYLRICADQNISGVSTITESDESLASNCGAWTAVSVSSTPAPDIIVSVDAATAPATPVAGSLTTLSATVKNNGTAVAGATFTNNFQIDNDANHSTSFATSTDPTASPNLAALATDPTSATYTFASAGTYYIRACADENATMTGTIVESNEANNCGAWVTVTVVNPPVPDLTSGAVSPAIATAAVPTDFSATISNIGTASSLTSFTSLLQRADAWDGTTATNPQDLVATTTSILAASAAKNMFFTYTFPAADAGTTRYLRVCADKATMSDAYGAVDEGPAHSGEANNCGPWTAVGIPALPQPHTIVTADSQTISEGQSTMIHWTSTNSTSCSGTGLSTGGAISGSVSTGVLNSAGSQPYLVTCFGAAGTNPHSDSVTVTVNPAGATTVFGNPIVSPNTTTTVTGTCTGSTHGQILDHTGTIVAGAGAAGNADPATGIWTATITTPPITVQTSYTTVCTRIVGGPDVTSKKFINLKTTVTPF